MPVQPVSATSGTLAKIITILAVLVPPTAIGAGFWAQVRSHPVPSVGVLGAYWALLGVGRLLLGVGGALKAIWVPRLAAAADRIIMTAVSGYRRKYVRQLRASVRDVEMVGVPTQMEYVLRLEQVYVDVTLVPQPLHETSGEPFIGKLTALGERRTLDWFLRRANRQVYAVIGGPGSGKTTLLRHTALNLSKFRARPRLLPILLYLRDHATSILEENPPSLPEAAVQVNWLTGRVPADWLQRRLYRGGCLIMLDGLDEVADEGDRKKVVSWVIKQIQRYPNNEYIVTSRPLGYLSNPVNNANILQVRRFTGAQISMFLHSCYYAIECRATGEHGEHIRSRTAGKAEDLLARLRAQPALYDLAANPLLLTMIANVHRYRGALPGSRAALYSEMCQVLLHRRQEAKGLIDSATGLTGEQKERLVRVLALTMMKRKIRDISSSDACKVIAPFLRRVSKENVRPEAFLGQVHSSGLLIEREHDVYAFTHLTLQEYLAAAQIRESQEIDLLVDAVDDPWWKEATRLWAADADATPIVRACLMSGSIRALELAFDCVDEAREIAPDVRQELEDLLASPAITADSVRKRRFMAMKAARILREVIFLSENTTVCTRPVTNRLYALFADAKKDSAYPIAPMGEESDDTAPGVWRDQVTELLEWLNSLFDDGSSFRLPTERELTDPLIDLVADLSRHTIWMEEGSQPKLFCRVGTPHPYSPSEQQLQRILADDCQQITPLLRVALAVMFASARDHNLRTRYDVIFGLAHEVAYSLDLAFALLYHLSRRLADALANRFAMIPQAADSQFTRDLAVAGDRARNITKVLDVGEPWVMDGVRARGRLLLSDLDVALVSARSSYYLDGGIIETIEQIRAEADELSKILDFTQQLSYFAARQRARSNDYTYDVRADYALAYGLINDVVDNSDTGPSGMDAERVAATAYFILIALWGGGDEGRRAKDTPLTSFAAYLRGTLSRVGGPSVVMPDEVRSSIRLASERIQESSPTEGSSTLHKITGRLINEVELLLMPLLTSREPHDEKVMSSARLALLAALRSVAYLQQEDVADDVIFLIRKAVLGLVALSERAKGGIIPNEAVILVRT